MKIKFLPIFLTALLCLIFGVTHANESTDDAVTKLRKNTGQTALEWASLQYEAALFSGGVKDLEQKRINHKIAIKEIYSEALNQLNSNDKAQSLLKEYYIKWQTAYDGTEPMPGEAKFAYKSRQGELIRSVNEAWYRFDAER